MTVDEMQNRAKTIAEGYVEHFRNTGTSCEAPENKLACALVSFAAQCIANDISRILKEAA